MPRLLFALALSALVAPSTRPIQEPAPERELRVEVRPQVELVTLVARLAGFEEFAMANSRSPYASAIEAHFAHLADHPVLEHLRALRRERGVSYDALASLAVHLGPLPDLAELVPFDAAPERLDARWGDQARVFVEHLRDFARAGHASEFFAGQRTFYAEVEARLRARLATSPALPWFDSFFGQRPGARYVAIAGLLCGGGNYGVGVRGVAQGAEEITPVFGCWKFDAEGVPVFDRAYLPTFVHELCHSYTNPIVDRQLALLEPLGQRLFAARPTQMQRQGYSNGRTVLYETFVRACVVRCRADTEGAKGGDEQARYETQRHFTWVPALAEALREYQADRERYPTLEAFVPRLAEVLEAQLPALEASRPPAPVLLASSPEDGAREVSPALAELTFTFDRPMRDQAWSVTGSAQDLPEIIGSPRYDAARRVLTLPVRLEPGRTYRVGLNSAAYQAFQSREGVPLEPCVVIFTTADA